MGKRTVASSSARYRRPKAARRGPGSGRAGHGTGSTSRAALPPRSAAKALLTASILQQCHGPIKCGRSGHGADVAPLAGSSIGGFSAAMPPRGCSVAATGASLKQLD